MVNPKTETVSVRDGMFSVETRIAGNGDPLVFLHGAMGQREWSPFLDMLSEGFTVYQPTHPGWTPSEGLDHIEDIVDFAIFYHDYFDALGLESPHLVGHSLGAMIAAEVAALNPSSVRKLVLSNPAGLWLDEAPAPDLFTMTQEQTMGAMLYDPSNAAVLGPRPSPDDHEAMRRMIFETQKSLAAAGKFLWPIWDKGLKKRIHRIKAPTLVIAGEKDGLVPPEHTREFQRRIAGSRLVTVDKTAHLPLIERPEEWVRVVREFLKG
jgi:pimeloyl-ACP methyl ester carboxylesterase